MAEAGSIRAASRALQVAQPNLSAQLTRIEQQLGVPVFERDRRGVRVTAAGRELVERARHLLLEADELVGWAERPTEVRALSYGLTLEAVLVDLTEEMRQARWTVRAALPGPAYTALRRGAAELFSGIRWPHLPDWPDGAGLEVVEVLRDRMVVVLPPGHRLADRPMVDLADLAGERWVVRTHSDATTIGECRRAGFEPDLSFYAEENETYQGLVGHGLAVSLASSVFRGGGKVVMRPYRDAASAQWVAAYDPKRFSREWAEYLGEVLRRRYRVRLAQVREEQSQLPAVG